MSGISPTLVRTDFYEFIENLLAGHKITADGKKPKTDLIKALREKSDNIDLEAPRGTGGKDKNLTSKATGFCLLKIERRDEPKSFLAGNLLTHKKRDFKDRHKNTLTQEPELSNPNKEMMIDLA
ncbi:hypothetical protein NDU88_002973 [Pleurodeles waltl]|uniref:Uncharacterized protein n=1 Tax=Pleurodeles waltl TaxID=8319 RepID=A0AAV7RBW1_PLEWA|nr:hypothetical protein NDU88_002973 [Pleurodeles waltl]